MKIKATLLKILYPKTDTETIAEAPTWYVMSTTIGRTVGATRITPKEGHTYTFEGDYSIYQGQQNFKFTAIEEDIPVAPKAILQYACSITKGLGPAFAEAILKKYGPDYTKRLAQAPANKREQALSETLQDLEATSSKTKAIAALISIGLTQLIAEQAVTRFGSETLALVRDDPYILATLRGQSFKTIDARIREPFRISLTDPRRIAAYLDYTLLQHAETDGSTLITTPILDLLADILPQGSTLSEDTQRALASRYPSIGQGFTLPRLYATENILFRYLKSSSHRQVTVEIPLPETLNAEQKTAIQTALNSTGFNIVNGGAGTGKTTIIKALADALKTLGTPFRIAAFAGRAAARIREATGYEASTIHALLGYTGAEGKFTKGDFDFGETIIIDEASMVPATLLAELCKRKPAALILFGDEAQLPPVGPGAPFHDLVKHCPHLVTTLTHCYRNREAIFAAATAVRQGTHPTENATSKEERFLVTHIRSPREAQETILRCLPSLDFDQDIIIAPRNGRDEPNLIATASSINHAIQDATNLPYPSIGSRLLCLKNAPANDVWNGTTGKITAIDTDGNAYTHLDTQKEVKLPADYLAKQTTPAYALTIHKAQGSQYRRVVILALSRDLHTLLDRKMLYTAITRAKQDCLIITDLNLSSIITRDTTRDTILQALIQEDNDVYPMPS